ncbi:MAG: chemotaxis protein CheC [Butyrivibrio sp.]|nr:chemotaxis protein CheC [Butyrivibrio sp.]
MGELNLDKLTDLEFDVLKEIGNIGAGNATTALSQMMNIKIDMSVPNVALIPITEIAGMIGSEETIVVGILLGMEGDVMGMMMFLFTEKSAHTIVSTLLGMEPDMTAEIGEMEFSALSEIGNIIAGAYLSALSTLTGLTVLPSVPALTIDMAGAILSVPAIEYGKIGDKVLFIETNLGEDDSLSGYIVMVPELESYGKILTSLGIQV